MVILRKMLLPVAFLSFAYVTQGQNSKGTLAVKNFSFPYLSAQDNINYHCGLVDIALPLDACGPVKSPNIESYFVLVEQGNCTYSTKLRNVESAGYFMAIIYPKTADGGLLIMAYRSNISIPAVYTSLKAGVEIKDQMGNAPVTLCVRPKFRQWPRVLVYSLTIGPVVLLVLVACVLLRSERNGNNG